MCSRENSTQIAASNSIYKNHVGLIGSRRLSRRRAESVSRAVRFTLAWTFPRAAPTRARWSQSGSRFFRLRRGGKKGHSPAYRSKKRGSARRLFPALLFRVNSIWILQHACEHSVKYNVCVRGRTHIADTGYSLVRVELWLASTYRAAFTGALCTRGAVCHRKLQVCVISI